MGLVIGLVLLFVLNWVLFFFSIGLLSGWSRLAQRYPFVGRNTPPKRSFTGGVVGNITYRRTILLGVDSAGLYLAQIPPFHVGHRPLLIPWDAVQATYESPSYRGQVRLVLHDPTLPVLLLSEKALQSARAYLPPSQQEARYSSFGWRTLAAMVPGLLLGIGAILWLFLYPLLFGT